MKKQPTTIYDESIDWVIHSLDYGRLALYGGYPSDCLNVNGVLVITYADEESEPHILAYLVSDLISAYKEAERLVSEKVFDDMKEAWFELNIPEWHRGDHG